MLEQARRILVENGQEIATDGTFYLYNEYGFNYLQKYSIDGTWYLSIKSSSDTEITLSELETILKDG